MSAKIETIVVRDPDGPTDVYVFVDGVPVKSAEYVIDAGAGWDWEDWRARRDANLAAASSDTVRTALTAVYSDPPGGQYVEDREDAGWLS